LALRYAEGSAPAPVASTAHLNARSRTQNWIKLGDNVTISHRMERLFFAKAPSGHFILLHYGVSETTTEVKASEYALPRITECGVATSF
jgi:hypothetical protein